MEVEAVEVVRYDDENPFSYHNLTTKLKSRNSIIMHSGYYACIDYAADKNFIMLEKMNSNIAKSSQLIASVSRGPKIHISIADTKDDDLSLHRAWDIVSYLVIKYGITKVKIIKNDARSLMRNCEKAGKEITWYMFKDNLSAQQINKFLDELTYNFIIAGVLPGAIAKHDDGIIRGSNYFTFRFDKNIRIAEINIADLFVSLPNQPCRIVQHLEEPPDINRNTTSDTAPPKITMEDIAIDQSEGYNDDDNTDGSSCRSRFCP